MRSAMIVDDEPFLQEMYQDMLDLLDVSVSAVVSNGEEAVSRYPEIQKSPTFILMDYRMPHMNGINATRKILELDPRAKILFVSADSKVIDEALEAGALGFLVKPFTIAALKKAILDILD